MVNTFDFRYIINILNKNIFQMQITCRILNIRIISHNYKNNHKRVRNCSIIKSATLPLLARPIIVDLLGNMD